MWLGLRKQQTEPLVSLEPVTPEEICLKRKIRNSPAPGNTRDEIFLSSGFTGNSYHTGQAVFCAASMRFCSGAVWEEDLYRGMPSGMPQRTQKTSGFSRCGRGRTNPSG